EFGLALASACGEAWAALSAPLSLAEPALSLAWPLALPLPWPFPANAADRCGAKSAPKPIGSAASPRVRALAASSVGIRRWDRFMVRSSSFKRCQCECGTNNNGELSALIPGGEVQTEIFHNEHSINFGHLSEAVRVVSCCDGDTYSMEQILRQINRNS